MESFFKMIISLLYLVIPIILTAKKKNKQRARRQSGTPAQERPRGSKAAQSGSLIGKFESIIKELEKAAQSRIPADNGKPTKGPAAAHDVRTNIQDTSNKGAVATGVPGQGVGIPVWRVASSDADTVISAKDEMAIGTTFHRQSTALQGRKATPAMTGKRGALFGKDDIIKGIILSEILQPPMVLRNRNKGRHLGMG